MIFKTSHLPTLAKTGDAWVCPHGTFKRVLSRGGAWENVNLGSTHPDEVNHGEQQQERPKAEQRDDEPEVPGGTGESTQGDGDDGQVSGVSTGGEENSELTEEPAPPEGEGFDGNGSPVV